VGRAHAAHCWHQHALLRERGGRQAETLSLPPTVSFSESVSVHVSVAEGMMGTFHKLINTYSKCICLTMAMVAFFVLFCLLRALGI